MKGAFGGRGDRSILSTTPAFQDSAPSSHALSELLAYGVAHGLCGSAPNERRVHFPSPAALAGCLSTTLSSYALACPLRKPGGEPEACPSHGPGSGPRGRSQHLFIVHGRICLQVGARAWLMHLVDLYIFGFEDVIVT